MAHIEKAKNHEGKTIFPVTVADAVLMGDGKTLKGELSELGSEMREIVYDSMFDGEGTEYKSSDGWQNKPCYIDTEGKYQYWEGVAGWYYTTPYIPCEGISEVTMKGRFVRNTSAITQYDKDYNVISARVEEDIFELSEVILENTKFIRCCGDVRYPLELRMKNSSYKEYVRKIQENQIVSLEQLRNKTELDLRTEKERAEKAEHKNAKDIGELDLLICDTMLNVDGVEFKDGVEWDYMRSIFLAVNTGKETHYDVNGPFYISPYIVVKGINAIHVKMRSSNNTALCVFYDEKKNVINVINSEGSIDIDKDIEIPSNTFSCRLCGHVEYGLNVSIPNSSYKEYVRKVQESTTDSMNEAALIICDTMLNNNGDEFRSKSGWDEMKSVFLAKDSGLETHYDVNGPFYVSPYIIVKEIAILSVKMRTSANTAYCVFYDNKKNIVGILNAEGSADVSIDISIPNNAFYCRMCGNVSGLLKVYVKGSVYKEYVRKILNNYIYIDVDLIEGLLKKNVDGTKTENNTIENPLFTIKETAGLTSIFHEIGFIGDSLSSGLNYDPYGWEASNIFDGYPFSWCQRLVALIGNANGANYSVGGWTARSWISNVWVNEQSSRYTTNGKEEYFKTDKKQCYFICLGTNDNNQNIPTGSVDTDIDMSDFSNNADTFAGNYGGIIQRIKSVQPSAKIFVITIPKYFSPTAEDNGYNTVIRDISKKFGNVFLLDVQKYSPDVTSLYRYGGHLDTPGYQWFAYLIATYVDYIIRANELKFRYVSIIGTEHDHGDL